MLSFPSPSKEEPDSTTPSLLSEVHFTTYKLIFIPSMLMIYLDQMHPPKGFKLILRWVCFKTPSSCISNLDSWQLPILFWCSWQNIQPSTCMLAYNREPLINSLKWIIFQDLAKMKTLKQLWFWCTLPLADRAEHKFQLDLFPLFSSRNSTRTIVLTWTHIHPFSL